MASRKSWRLFSRPPEETSEILITVSHPSDDESEDVRPLQAEEGATNTSGIGSSDQTSIRLTRSISTLSTLFQCGSSIQSKSRSKASIQDPNPNPNHSVRRKPAPALPSYIPPNPPIGIAPTSHGNNLSLAPQHPNTFQDQPASQHLPPPSFIPAPNQSYRQALPPYQSNAELENNDLPIRGRQGRNENSIRPRPPVPAPAMGSFPSTSTGTPLVPSSHMQSHINTMAPPPVPSAHYAPRMTYPPGPTHVNTKGPPLAPSPHNSSPMQHPSGPSHLTKQRPRQTVDNLPQPPSYQSSSRSSSQPSPMAGTRLHKPIPAQSGHLSPASHSPGASPTGFPVVQSRERSHSLVPPSGNLAGGSNRVVSSPVNPTSPSNAYHSDHSGGSPDGRQDKRRSWMFGGGRSRSSSKSGANQDGQPAWVCTSHGTVPYNAQILLSGEKV